MLVVAYDTRGSLVRRMDSKRIKPNGGDGMNQQGQIVPHNERITTLRTMLDKSKAQIAMALPKHMTPDRMLRIAMTSVQRNPKLLECTPESFCGAIIQSAQLGLEPDGVLGHAYLIPFWNGKKRVTEVQFMPGYKGLLDLSRRSGNISTIYARVVYAKDSFTYRYGLDPDVTHTPTREDDPGAIVAVYAVACLRDGGQQFEVMLAREVESIREQSKKRNKGKESGAWSEHVGEMYKKTVLRRLCKLLPVSVELQKAVALDEHEAAGIPQDLSAILDVSSEPAADVPPKEPEPEPPAPVAEAESETAAYDPIIVDDWRESIRDAAQVTQCNELIDKAGKADIDPDTTKKITELCNERAEAIRNKRGEKSNQQNFTEGGE